MIFTPKNEPSTSRTFLVTQILIFIYLRIEYTLQKYFFIPTIFLQFHQLFLANKKENFSKLFN